MFSSCFYPNEMPDDWDKVYRYHLPMDPMVGTKPYGPAQLVWMTRVAQAMSLLLRLVTIDESVFCTVYPQLGRLAAAVVGGGGNVPYMGQY